MWLFFRFAKTRLAASFLVTVLLVLPRLAEANGIVSHYHISDLAKELLPDGELRDLLNDPELLEALRSGSVFPDSGYAVSDPYGEMGHWEPFTEAYIRHIRENFGPPPYESEAARQNIAFLMGQSSHGMADQWFDSLFMARVNQYDGTNETLDLYAEEFLIIEHNPDDEIEGWIDAATINQVFTEGLDYNPGVGTLEDGMGRISAAVYLLFLMAGATYETHWMEIPWAGTHYYLPGEDAPGSLPHIAQVVALYWQVLWQRLHETDEMSESLLLTWPPDGYENFEVDHTLIETRIAIAFGHGIDRDTLTSENVRLLDEANDAQPANVRFIYGSEFANVVLVRPTANLDYDEMYTVDVGTGLRSIDGRSLGKPFTFSFRTRCAPDHLGDCPPLPDPWEPPDEPPARPDGDADADIDADADADEDADAESDTDADVDRDAESETDADPDEDQESEDVFSTDGGACDCSVGRSRSPDIMKAIFALFSI